MLFVLPASESLFIFNPRAVFCFEEIYGFFCYWRRHLTRGDIEYALSCTLYLYYYGFKIARSQDICSRALDRSGYPAGHEARVAEE